ncbi:MAG TPA: DNA polymerase Y family protein [Xanthobacteraceae bacterium]
MWSSVSSSQRILSLWLERLSTDRLAQQRHEDRLFSSPLVVFGKRNNLDLVVAVNAAAEQLGLRDGLALAQARAMHPGLIAQPEEPTDDARVLEAIADWCGRYTPLVATDRSNDILLDISGCAHLFGDEQKLRDDLLTRMTGFGFSVRAAVASTIGAAWASAHFDDIAIVPPGEEHELLVPLPLAALRLPQDTVAALTQVGLKRIGDIIDLPRSPLAARFGTDLLRQLDRALGREYEPLSPRLPVAPYIAEKSFPDSIAREQDVLATVERLAARLKLALAVRGDGARNLELALFRTDGVVRRIAVGTSRPLRDPAAIRTLFVERLATLGDAMDPGFGFDLARLSVLVAEPCPEEQIGLGSSANHIELDHLIDRLSARLGRTRVTRQLAQDSHIPELASSAVPAQRAVDLGWEAFRRFRSDVTLSARPMRLLPSPEPIHEVLALVPDGPPVRFRWRRAWHDVIAVEGPERIEGAWWHEESGGPTRDYFRVEDRAGLRFWVFRAGLYHAVTPRWFLHGMYA